MTQQDLIEQNAILQLLYKYAMSVDARDVEAYATCFTPDVVVSGPGFEMRENVAKATIDMLTSMFEATMHNVHNYSYKIEGERATGVTYCVASHIQNKGGQRSKMDMYIRYHDELVKQAGEWRFAKRRLDVMCTTTVPVDPAA
jgi:uncharacterized protein (TIGR02246 family)